MEVFNGRRNDELFREYRRWLPYITDVFLPICDSESGDLRTMPFPGSLMDQPYMTMQIVLLVQEAYRKTMSERMEKMRPKAGKQLGGRRRK